MINKKYQHLQIMFGFLVCSLILLYFIYAPVLNIPFYHHDIYKFTDGGIEKTCMQDYGFFNNLIQGRPLVGLLDCLNFKLAYNPVNMAYVRFSCLLILSLFSTIIAMFIHTNIKPNDYIFPLLVGVACACFPGMQTFMIMGAHSLIIASAVSLLAYLLAAKGIAYIDKSYTKACARFGLGGILLLASMLIYPAVSSFFLLSTLILLLFNPINNWRTHRKYVLMSVAVFVVTCAVYFAFGKAIQHFLITDSYSQRYMFNPNFHLGERMVGLLLTYPTLWSIQYPLLWQSIVVYFCTIISAIISFKANKPALKNVMAVVITVILLMLLGAYAYLMQPENLVFTRILLVFQVMSFFLLFALLANAGAYLYQRDIRATLALFFVIFAGACTNYTLTKSVLNDITEMHYLMAILENNLLKSTKIKRVHIIGLQYESKSNFNGHHERDDIFNINSTLYRQDAYYMVKAALQELGMNKDNVYNCGLDEFQLMKTTEAECIKNAPKDSIIVTYSRRGEKVEVTPGTLVIDMSEDGIKLRDGR